MSLSQYTSASEAWLDHITAIDSFGHQVSPRDQDTRELMSRTIRVNMRQPVVNVPQRKLNYKFMVAEAYWILSGDDTVAGIEGYNKHIAQFSDDGEIFFGAYGPRISSQLNYVVRKLSKDRDSRQAGLTIWRENPPESKDIPCTIALFFSIRDNRLNCNAYMRSSDAWLGAPYDIFNFSMLTHKICSLFNEANVHDGWDMVISPGDLHLTAASAHIYFRDFDGIKLCVNEGLASTVPQPDTKDSLFLYPGHLMKVLDVIRETSPGHDLRWWDHG